MAKLEKRSNPPQNLAMLSSFTQKGEKCGVCHKPANRRMYNAWRVIDVCTNPQCALQGGKWVCNSPFTKRVDAPLQTFRKPGEFKYMTRRADPLPKPPGRQARAR